MGRLLGIDFGLRRTGIAVTDPLQIISTPLETIETSRLIQFLQAYVNKEPVDAFVVGMPKTMANEESSVAPYVKKFVGELARYFPGRPVHLVDERFTSAIARRALIDGGMKKKQRRDKANLDKISAAIILQGFLDSGHQTS
ncbi:MAG TPA: Holliday junction resolvase RuvX [Cyclobacteriaceae bacterium]